MGLEQLRSEAQAATEHLAAIQRAMVEAEAGERAALDAHDPTDPSPKALAPVEAARARVASAKHHLDKATARETAARYALGRELLRLAREEFDAAADQFGMRGWEKGNAERLAAYHRARSEERRLLRELLDDVERWNESAPSMFEIARRTGHLDEVPPRASTGAIADFMKAWSHPPPFEIEGVRGLFLPVDQPEHRYAIAWGRKLLRRVVERAVAGLPDGAEIEPSEFFAKVESALAQCKPANTPSGTVTHAAFLLGEEEWLAARTALSTWREEFARPEKVREVRDEIGRRVEQRRMVVDRGSVDGGT